MLSDKSFFVGKILCLYDCGVCSSAGTLLFLTGQVVTPINLYNPQNPVAAVINDNPATI